MSVNWRRKLKGLFLNIELKYSVKIINREIKRVYFNFKSVQSWKKINLVRR